MEGIQARPIANIQPTSIKNATVSFGSSHYMDEDDSFDKEAIEAERDEKLDQINESRNNLDNLADELENSENKVARKASKLVRYGSAAFGLAATFVTAKVSSKLAIEALKSAGRSEGMQTVLKTAGSMKKPIMKTFEETVKFAKNLADKPIVKDNIKKVVDSKFGQKAAEILKNEKVAKVLEPLKETVKSIKDIKVNGKNIQNTAENVMAATTTGSVLIDDLAGRNSDKSNIDLATGV